MKFPMSKSSTQAPSLLSLAVRRLARVPHKLAAAVSRIKTAATRFLGRLMSVVARRRPEVQVERLGHFDPHARLSALRKAVIELKPGPLGLVDQVGRLHAGFMAEHGTQLSREDQNRLGNAVRHGPKAYAATLENMLCSIERERLNWQKV